MTKPSLMQGATTDPTRTPEGGTVVRMRGQQLNEANPIGPGIKKGSYDPALTYVVTLDPQGVPQDAKEVGAGYAEGGPVDEAAAADDMAEPGDTGSEEEMKTGTFDEYKDKGVSEDLVKQGNDLADRIQSVVDSGDKSQSDQFFQEVKDFVSAIESAREQAMQDGDPELMRGLKEMLGDAKDLQASVESILAEGGTGMAGVENNPESTMKRNVPETVVA